MSLLRRCFGGLARRDLCVSLYFMIGVLPRESDVGLTQVAGADDSSK